MMSKESVRRAVEEFTVRPTDVVVATFSKTGTTLVCWICHLLRILVAAAARKDDGGGGGCGVGEINIEDEAISNIESLYEVVPWPLLCYDIGYDPNVDGNRYEPRVFKSHLRMASVYRGCKYVVTVRDPSKTTLSFYNFLLSKGVPHVVDLPDVSSFLVDTPFVKGVPDRRASIWEYYREYHQLLSCDSVLIVVYEDLIGKSKPQWVTAIANFIMGGIVDEEGEGTAATSRITPDLIDIVCQKSTKEHMSKYNHLFDEPYERAKELGRAGDLSQLAPGNKVVVGDHPQTLNETAERFLRLRWEETMKPLGYDNYESFASAIRERNKERFGLSL